MTQRFILTFPSDLNAKQINAWLRTVSGAFAGRRGTGLVLELLATDHGFEHHLAVPDKQVDFVVAQLRSQVPGIRVTPDKRRKITWTRAVELSLSTPDRTLAIPAAEVVAGGLLACLQGLDQAEAVMVQWVITPAVPESPPQPARQRRSRRGSFRGMDAAEPSSDDLNDRRAKLGEGNFLAALRVASSAASSTRADDLLERARSVFASVQTPATRFKKRFGTSSSGVIDKIEQGRGNLLYSVQLTTSELSALLGWPIGFPHVAGLPQGGTRQLPATAAVSRGGLVIGHSTFPGAERPVAVTHLDATKHLHILGPTGTGKTTALANLAFQTMVDGFGCVVMESKGDLFHQALNCVPRKRLTDVIVLDVNDTDFPVGFNVLRSGSSHAAVDELSALITSIYGDSGIYTPMLLYYGLHALAEAGLTFIDLPSLLSPQGPEEVVWREHLVANLVNREVRQFWQRFLTEKQAEQARMVAPVHNRIWQLAVRPEIRNIIGQRSSSFTFEEVLTENKILLINLNGVRVGEMAASITGTLLMNALWSAVRTVKKAKPSFLFLDEFQDFVNLPVGAADMLAKTRSFGLGMVLAHQDLDQLSKVRGLEQAVLANARTKIVYQTSARDARVMQSEFGRLVTAEDFQNLGRYEAIARVATADGVSAPVTLTALPPVKPTNLGKLVRLASRTAYGRPVARVEDEIDTRRRVNVGSSTPKPKVGPQQWGTP